MIGSILSLKPAKKNQYLTINDNSIYTKDNKLFNYDLIIKNNYGKTIFNFLNSFSVQYQRIAFIFYGPSFSGKSYSIREVLKRLIQENTRVKVQVEIKNEVIIEELSKENIDKFIDKIKGKVNLNNGRNPESTREPIIYKICATSGIIEVIKKYYLLIDLPGSERANDNTSDNQTQNINKINFHIGEYLQNLISKGTSKLVPNTNPLLLKATKLLPSFEMILITTNICCEDSNYASNITCFDHTSVASNNLLFSKGKKSKEKDSSLSDAFSKQARQQHVNFRKKIINDLFARKRGMK